jgi:hypothetical protein
LRRLLNLLTTHLEGIGLDDLAILGPPDLVTDGPLAVAA